MTRINYLSDFKLLLTLKVNGEPIDFDALSVRLVFSASGLPYECRSAGWVNCIDQGDGKLLCLFNRHKLGKGALQCLMYVCEADAQMPDGDMVQVMPLDLDVELVTGAGDNTIGEATVELSALYRLLVESASAAQVAARNAADSMSAAAASADDAGDAAVLARAAQVAAEDAAERAAEVGGYSKSEADALLALKADKATTYTKGEVDDLLLGKAAVGTSYTKSESDSRYAKPSDIPAQVQSDWSQSDNTAADYIKSKPSIPSALSDLSDDSTHRVVTDAEKTTWGGKADKVAVIDASTTDDPAAITQAIAPNTFYDFGVVDSLTITLTAGESGYLAIYAFSFEANTASTTLTLPATIVGDAPTIAAGKRYECNILDNRLLFSETDGND